MRISYCTWGMREIPIEEALPAVAEIGYQGIELAVTRGWPTEIYSLDDAKRKQIKELLAENNLALSAIAGHCSMCETDPEKNEANMRRLRDSIDLAAELRQEGELAIMASLVGGHEDDWGKLKNLVAERVQALGDYAAQRDVILAVEPHSGTCLDLPRKALWLVETLNHPSVMLNFDCSHFDIVGLPIEDYVPQLAPYSVHTHVKDQIGIYPNFKFLTPGSGPFDFVAYLKAMHEAGYRGFVGMEVSVQVQRRPGYDPFVDAALGYWALVHAFNESGAPLEK